jgi:phosphate-selective porin OprO/OprP
MATFRRWIVLMAILSLFGTFAYAAEPATKTADSAAIEERLSRLEEEIRMLRSELAAAKKEQAQKAETDASAAQDLAIVKRQLELDREAAAEKAKTAPVMTASAKDGFSIKSPDNDFILKLRGLLQADTRAVSGKKGSSSDDTFLMRRVRPIFEGTIYKNIDFKFVPDFGQGTTAMQDAYFDLKYVPEARLQVGRIKSPFGIERLQSSADTLFTELGLSGNLTPNYDIGAALHSESLLDGRLSYSVGLFNGAPDNTSIDSDIDGSKEIAARIFVNPFKGGDISLLDGLGVGFATTFGNETGTSTSTYLPTYKTMGQQTFFSYKSGVIADGDHVRYSPQAYYSYGSFGLLAEQISSLQNVTLGSASKRLNNTGWQVAASYLLTGEAATYKSVVPREAFDPANGKWGAIELVARLSELDIDNDAFPTFATSTSSASSAKAWGAGLNWYLNKNAKWQFDYETTSFVGGDTGRDRRDEQAVMTRIQLAF